MSRLSSLPGLLVCALALGQQEPAVTKIGQDAQLDWHCDYRSGVTAARESDRRLVLLFADEQAETGFSDLQHEIAGQLTGNDDPSRHIFCVLSLQATYGGGADSRLESGPKKLLDHPAFRELAGGPGVVVINYDSRSKYAGKVVSTVPFHDGAPMSAAHFCILLGLPDASLTQRTLIYAIRIHPSAPLSTNGEVSSLLMNESESHARDQAARQLQGHHDWEARFHRINAELPAEQVAQEVCAESWPGEDLFEAALECVHSWSQSPGHWEAVSRYHPQFGYDMKKGHNGIWYGTGIFGRQRE